MGGWLIKGAMWGSVCSCAVQRIVQLLLTDLQHNSSHTHHVLDTSPSLVSTACTDSSPLAVCVQPSLRAHTTLCGVVLSACLSVLFVSCACVQGSVHR